MSRTDGASERRSDNRPALKLKRRPIIKSSLPTSPRLRRTGREGMFSAPERATEISASPASLSRPSGTGCETHKRLSKFQSSIIAGIRLHRGIHPSRHDGSCRSAERLTIAPSFRDPCRRNDRPTTRSCGVAMPAATVVRAAFPRARVAVDVAVVVGIDVPVVPCDQ